MARVSPKIDLVFKKLFGSEENKDILMSLINAILPPTQQISNLTLKNPYNVSDYAQGKLSILDIKAEDEFGNLYDIEMQLRGSSFYGKRTLYYWAKIFGSQLDYLDEEGSLFLRQKEYSELHKCIVISLMDFRFFDDHRYQRCFMLKDRETNQGHPDLDYLDLYFIELNKFDKDLRFVQSALERWIAFLNYAEMYSQGTLPEPLAEIAPIRKANERLAIMSFSKKEREYYESQQKRYLDEYSRIQETVREAVEEAVKDAELKKQIEIAQKMLLRGQSPEMIAELTGLSLLQIAQLRNEQQG